MPYQSVGGAATGALLDALAERERSKQQALQNQRLVMQDQLARDKEAREAQYQRDEIANRQQQLAQDEAKAKAGEERAKANDFRSHLDNSYIGGDIITDAGTAAEALQYTPDRIQVKQDPGAVGPVPEGQMPVGSAIRILPNKAERAIAQAKAESQQADQVLAQKYGGPEGLVRARANPLETEMDFQAAHKTVPAALLTLPKETGYAQAEGMMAPGGPAVRWNTTLGRYEDTLSGQPVAAQHRPSATATVGPTPDQTDVDFLARAYATGDSNALAGLGWGNAGMPFKMAVIHRAAQFDKSTGQFAAPGTKPTEQVNLAEARGGYKADQASLTSLQRMADATNAFSGLADANAKLLNETLKKVPDTGISWANYPVRNAARVLGSTGMTDFNVARQAVANEFGKLVATPNMTGVFTDDARKAANTLIDPDATVGQIQSAVQMLQREAKNRRSAYQGQVDDIKKRLGGNTSPASASPASSIKSLTLPSGKTVAVGDTVKLKNGTSVVVKDIANGQIVY